VSTPRPSRDGSPFELLGLPASAGVTDQDVRAAWRRIAAATHPDRPDGGDAERFAAASAAYTALRTRSGRGEALADRGRAHPAPGVIAPPREAPTARRAAAAAEAPVARAAAPGPVPAGPLARLAARVRNGRPAVLTARLLRVIPPPLPLPTGRSLWSRLGHQARTIAPGGRPPQQHRKLGAPPGIVLLLRPKPWAATG